MRKKKKKLPYTPREWARARQLFNADKKAGTLKPPRGLFAIAFSDGRTASASCAVTESDYLPEARRQLGEEGA